MKTKSKARKDTAKKAFAEIQARIESLPETEQVRLHELLACRYGRVMRVESAKGAANYAAFVATRGRLSDTENALVHANDRRSAAESLNESYRRGPEARARPRQARLALIREYLGAGTKDAKEIAQALRRDYGALGKVSVKTIQNDLATLKNNASNGS
jgi:hypothetical protein